MSKKIENVKTQAIIYFVSVFIASLVLFPLLDLFWTNVITHSEFQYNANEYIIQPLIFSVIITLVLYVPLVTRHNKNAKETAKKK
jgi:uncharacterized membrane protein